MRQTAAVFALAAALASPAFAASLAGVTVADTVQVGDQQLALNGLGLRSKLFIKVYVGALHLPQKQSDAAAILAADSPRQMSMDFLYNVKAGQMCDAWNEGLEANSPNAGAEVQAAFKTLCTYMEDLPKGNRLILTYVPGTGTTVEVNGKVKGTLPGKATADAILSTWIGPDPGPGEGFKKAILGG
jgi:chalcone isomerase-like protein